MLFFFFVETKWITSPVHLLSVKCTRMEVTKYFVFRYSFLLIHLFYTHLFSAYSMSDTLQGIGKQWWAKQIKVTYVHRMYILMKKGELIISKKLSKSILKIISGSGKYRESKAETNKWGDAVRDHLLKMSRFELIFELWVRNSREKHSRQREQWVLDSELTSMFQRVKVRTIFLGSVWFISDPRHKPVCMATLNNLMNSDPHAWALWLSSTHLGFVYVFLPVEWHPIWNLSSIDFKKET